MVNNGGNRVHRNVGTALSVNMAFLTYLLTYLLTPWSTVLLEKLNVSQLLKEFPAFYGTRNFITAFKSTGHLSLSRAISVQSMLHNPTS